MSLGDSPAFPSNHNKWIERNEYQEEWVAGMDIRTYVAIMAMQGLLCSGKAHEGAAYQAVLALEHADALLKQLEVKDNPSIP